MSWEKKPPVVTLMGHIDHGKTSLLDYIRKSKLAQKEAGGITQSIGAYQIEVGGQKITFIDTPGHEAFTKMRSRGAKAADLVVLVVAANDGVMPQTRESIRIIKESQTPFLVAINKVDLPEVSVDKVKAQLAEEGVLVEGYGGNIVAVPVSAKTGQGVDQLLEMILLLAELEELKADPQGDFEAFVIEAKQDKFCGPLVNMIVKNGTLKKGDFLQAEDVFGKVKMIRDDNGKSKEKALPGDPVQVLGFEALPKVGAVVTAARQEKPDKSTEEKSQRGNLVVVPEGGEEVLKIILKADTFGSLEALINCLPKEVRVVEASVGEITESDILMAKTLGCEIYGFNLSLSSSLAKLAESEKVKVFTCKIIYDLLEDIEKRLSKKEKTVKILGKAEILAVFEMKEGRVAGCRVLEGKILKDKPVLIQRGEEKLGETRIISLKEKKQDINEAVAGSEFGAIFSDRLDFKVGDVVLSADLE